MRGFFFYPSSPNKKYGATKRFHRIFGRGDGDRTHDLSVPNAARYQLRYASNSLVYYSKCFFKCQTFFARFFQLFFQMQIFRLGKRNAICEIAARDFSEPIFRARRFAHNDNPSVLANKFFAHRRTNDRLVKTRRI